jgi:hypothetical protein
MANAKYNAWQVASVAVNLARKAGHPIATWDTTQVLVNGEWSVTVRLTDERGTHFTFNVDPQQSGEWLSASELEDWLIEKYPLAFT